MTPQVWVTLSVGAVAVMIAVWGLRQARRVRLHQFEQLYIPRYRKLLDDLSAAARFKAVSAQPAAADGEPVLVEGDRVAALSYLELCEDEVELRASGWISDAIWTERKGTIQRNIEAWPFHTIWLQVRSWERFGALKTFMETREDPLDWGIVKRWWHCLLGHGA